MLRLERLRKRLGDFRLDVTELRVETGDYFVLLGPSGAGKSVLLSLIAGLHPLDAGRIWLGEGEITDLPPERRRVGYVGQKPYLFPNLSVRGNVLFGLRYQGNHGEGLRAHTDACIEMLKLGELLDRGVRDLSGGETQRVAVARALAIEPELLLLDEPFALLDHNARDAFREELKQLHRELGTTTLHVTHDRQEAAALADQAGVIADGRLLQTGSTDDLFHRPQSEFVARFLGVANVFPAVAACEGGDTARLEASGILIRAASDLEGPVQACIRPEAIRVASLAEPVPAGMNAVTGRLTELTAVGTTVRATLRSDGLELVCILPDRELRRTGLSVGDQAQALFWPTDVHVFAADNG